jgi:hypothetical protein
LTVALVLALVLALTVSGCAQPDSSESPATDARATDAGATDAGAAGASGAGRLLVLGRSVMTGWMAHWGGDASSPTEWNGYTVTFREIEGPPGIGRSAAEAISSAEPGTVVLFKFCFVDFNGGEWDSELDTYMQHVTRAADAARDRQTPLIIGTALPKVAGETTPELIAEHRAFGERLAAFVADRRTAGQTIAVLDLNRVLVGADGGLLPGYAVSPDDSHLNESAYDALDTALKAVLAEL